MRLGNSKANLLTRGQGKFTLVSAAFYRRVILLLFIIIPFSSYSISTGEAVPRSSAYIHDTIFYFVFLVLLLVFAVIKMMDREYLGDLFKAIFDSNILVRLRRDGKLAFHLNDILLDLNFVVVISLLIFALLGSSDFLLLVQIGGAVLAYYAVKIVLVAIFSAIFFGEAFSAHLQQVLLFNKVFGILLLPLIFILYFSSDEMNTVVIWGITAFAVIFYLYRFIRVLLRLKNDYHYGILYYLLYLCTTELSPYLIIFKRITGFFY